MMPSLKMSSPWINQTDIWELIAMLWEGVRNAVSEFQICEKNDFRLE